MDFELLEESLARIDNHLNQHDQKFAEITSTLPLEERFSLVSDTIKELADKFHGLESRFYKVLTLADDVQVLLHRTENQSNKLLNLEDRVDLLTQELDQPVGIPASAHGLNDLAIQAETDMVRSNLRNEPSLASDVLSLCVSQLITKEEARRLMGFKS